MHPAAVLISLLSVLFVEATPIPDNEATFEKRAINQGMAIDNYIQLGCY